MTKAAKLLDMNVKQHYLDAFTQFERNVTNTDKPALRRLRNTAIAHFDTQAWPGSKEEDWRFMPLNNFLQHTYRLSTEATSIKASELKAASLQVPNAIRLTFIDGHFSPSHSNLDAIPADVHLMPLRTAMEKHPALVEEHLGRSIHLEKNLFASLATAFLHDGFFLHLPKNVVLEKPIHLCFLDTGHGVMNFPRILVVAASHSQARIVESFHSLGGGVNLTVPVSEFYLADHAEIQHIRVNDASPACFHFLTQHTLLARSANFTSQAITLGGAIVRNEITAVMNGEAATCTLNGLYTADEERLVGNYTFIDHVKPHCPSYELYKGVLSGHGKGVFNGKIYVHQEAQKTDAKQTNQTLLLSPDATINTKPQLEIFADDVKCTHGATVGYLDRDPLFYLRSRGIPLAEAEAILAFAFANDIVGKIEIAAVREYLEKRFTQPEV